MNRPAPQKKNNCFTYSVAGLFGMIVCMIGVFVFALFQAPDVEESPTLDVLEAVRRTMDARPPTETMASRMVEIPAETVTMIPALPTFTRLPTIEVLPTQTMALVFTLTSPSIEIQATNTTIAAFTLPPPPTDSGYSGNCTCHKPPDLNCDDFSSQAKAQACYDRCVALGFGDVYGLDRDNDGRACE